jgi:hypothetical protein
MARGDAIDDAAFDHLVRNLPLGPVGNGSPGLAGGLAGHGDDGADLLGGDLRRLARAWGIAESILNAQLGQGDRLQEHPAFAPGSDHVESDLMHRRDGRVAQPISGVQDDLGSQGQLLGGRVLSAEAQEGLALLVGQFDSQGFGASHDRLLARRLVAGPQQIRQSLYCRSNSAKLH